MTITENSGSTLTNYQVKITVPYDSDMQADFDDIRFTDENGSALIDHWLESKTDSTTADFWVEIPTLTASLIKTIYVYYGNGAITSGSNGVGTFLFFDDFTNDATGWVAVDGTWAHNATDGTYDYTGGGTGQVLGRYDMSIVPPYTAHARARKGTSDFNFCTRYDPTVAGNYHGSYYSFGYGSAGTYINIYEMNGSSGIAKYNVAENPGTSWHEFMVKDSSTHMWFYRDGSSVYDFDTTTFVTNGQIAFNSWAGGQTTKFDWVFVRKYAVSEPTVVTLGLEENANTLPTASFNSVTQKTDGTGKVDISIEADDADDNDIKAKLEYVAGAGCDFTTPLDPTLDETEGAAADFNDSSGAPSVENDDVYQIGTTANYRIITSSGSNTITFDWDSAIDLPAANGTYCLRLTANDDTGDQTTPATQTVVLDNVDPSGYTVNINQPYINAGNETALSFTFVSAEAGAAYDYSIDDTNGGTSAVIGSGTIATATDIISNINVSTLDDDTLTLTVYLTDASGNQGANTTDTIVKDTVIPTASIAYSDADTIVKSGDSLTITATFSEALLDSPIVKLAISGSNTLSAADMTKTDTTHYTYIHTVGEGDGTATISLSIGTDVAGNVIVSAPTSGATFTVDNTAPTNQDTVFASSISKQSGQAVTIVSSGDATNNVWLAPSSTTTFTEGATITKAANGIATSILAPATVGDYKLFVIDAAGNYSAESAATLTVDGSAPTIISISSDKTNGSYKAGEVIDIDITFSEAVTSTGDVTVTLETGDTDQACTFTITNSTTGACDYTVQAGDNSSDLDATISGTIADQASNALTNYTPATTLSANKDLLIDTTAPAGTALSLGTITADSITAAVSGAVDSGAGLHATPYYFENTTASTNSGWTADISWASNNLSCGTEYSFRVKTRDSLTNESAFTSLSTSSTANCGSGLPSSAYNPPTAPKATASNPEGKFGVIINNNAEETDNPNVKLKLYAGADTKKMAISNYADFKNASQIPYETIFNYQFPISNQLSISNDQTLTIYVKFYTAYGVASEIVSDSIILKTNSIENQTGNSADQNAQDDFDNANNNSENSFAAPEPLAEAGSQNQNSPGSSITQTLQFGSNGQEVKTLQDRLKQLNFFPKEIISNGNFGPTTENAVKEYQKSKGIYPCGIVGPRTRKALNSEEFITNKDYQFIQDLKYNDKNKEVRQLQIRLQDQNFFPYQTKPTGWFGSITQKAVNLFQKFYDLIQSGIVDEGMREILNK